MNKIKNIARRQYNKPANTNWLLKYTTIFKLGQVADEIDAFRKSLEKRSVRE